MDALQAIADEYDLLIVEDACQAQGAEYQLREGRLAARRLVRQGRRVQLLSRQESRRLRRSGRGDDRRRAGARRRSGCCASTGRCRSTTTTSRATTAGSTRFRRRSCASSCATSRAGTASARAAAARYNELLAERARHRHCRSSPRPAEPVYHLYVIRTEDRDALAEQLKAAGVHTGLHYPLPVHLQKCYRDWGYQHGQPPGHGAARPEILSLPMFPGLTAEQQQASRRSRVFAGLYG